MEFLLNVNIPTGDDNDKNDQPVRQQEEDFGASG